MAGELLAEEKKGLFLDQAIFSGAREWQGFYFADCLFSLWRMERPLVADHISGT